MMKNKSTHGSTKEKKIYHNPGSEPNNGGGESHGARPISTRPGAKNLYKSSALEGEIQTF